MMRIDTDHTLFGYPAIALVLFLVGAGLGIAIVLSALLRRPQGQAARGARTALTARAETGVRTRRSGWTLATGVVFLLVGLALGWRRDVVGCARRLLVLPARRCRPSLPAACCCCATAARPCGSMRRSSLATLLWSLAEVRLDWWQLLPRLDLWFAMGAWLLLPWINRRLGAMRIDSAGNVTPSRRGNTTLRVALALTLLVGLIALTRNAHDQNGAFAADRPAAAQDVTDASTDEWIAYGHSSRGDRYSPAAQITPGNVGRLQLAWTYHTGDFRGPRDPKEFAAEVTPLMANGSLYLCTPHDIVIALDPDTGRQKWRFDPGINRDASDYQHMICRGVSYYDAAVADRGVATRRVDARRSRRPVPAPHLCADRRRHHRRNQCRHWPAVHVLRPAMASST